MSVDWVATATIASGMASVVSLAAVAWQLRSLARQTKASTDSVRAVAHIHTFTAAQEIDRFFADRPDVRAHFYGHLDGEESQDHLHRIDAVAEMLLDQFMMAFTQVDNMSPEIREGWRRYIRHVVNRSPAVRQFYERNREWYTLLELDDVVRSADMSYPRTPGRPATEQGGPAGARLRQALVPGGPPDHRRSRRRSPAPRRGPANMMRISTTVSCQVRVPQAALFEWFIPISLPRILRGCGPIPPVISTTQQTGPWNVAGNSRLVHLADGHTARETVTAYEPSRYFAYRVGDFDNFLRRLAHHATGEWWFTDGPDRSTRIRWTYTFHARNAIAAMVLLPIAKVFWRGLMRRAITTLGELAEAEAASVHSGR